MLGKERTRHLLSILVNHVEQFEDAEFNSVMENLGITKEELEEIQSYKYVKNFDIYDGIKIYELTKLGVDLMNENDVDLDFPYKPIKDCDNYYYVEKTGEYGAFCTYSKKEYYAHLFKTKQLCFDYITSKCDSDGKYFE